MEEKFKEFYASYKEQIDEFYFQLKKAKERYIQHSFIMAILLCCIFLVGTLGLLKISVTTFLWEIIIVCIALFVVCFGSVFIRLKPVLTKMTEKIMLDIIKYISGDEQAKFIHNSMISQESIADMELFNLDNLKYTGKNYIAANYNNNAMNFADMEIYYYKDKIDEEVFYDREGNRHVKEVVRKVKKQVFQGCYISATLNKKIAEHIYLIPNNIGDVIINGKLNDYLTYKGNEIELENLEFSKKYKVYSDNEIQARYILSLSLMEKINNIDDIFPDKKYIVFKEGRRFAICVDGIQIENLRKTLLPLKRREDIVEENIKFIFKRLYSLFDIYNILDLGDDLYV